MTFKNTEKKILSGFSNDVKNHKCGFPQVLQTVFSQNENVYKKFDNYLSQQIPLDLVYRSPSGHIMTEIRMASAIIWNLQENHLIGHGRLKSIP